MPPTPEEHEENAQAEQRGSGEQGDGKACDARTGLPPKVETRSEENPGEDAAAHERQKSGEQKDLGGLKQLAAVQERTRQTGKPEVKGDDAPEGRDR